MRVLALAFALLATPALAQTASTPQPDTAPASPPPAAAAPTTATDPVPVPRRFDRAEGARPGCSSSVMPTS